MTRPHSNSISASRCVVSSVGISAPGGVVSSSPMTSGVAAFDEGFEQWQAKWQKRLLLDLLANDAGDLIAVPEFTRCNVSRFAGRTGGATTCEAEKGRQDVPLGVLSSPQVPP